MKNPLLENLRVIVIPTETDNGIDQSSDVEEILNCPEAIAYPLTDYFKAQNDEEIDLSHWSFLIDITTKEDWTGSNINGIHQFDKASKIAVIKRIIEVWGATTVGELELDHSPCIHSQGNKLNISHLVEHFNSDHVVVVVYANETETSDYTLEYEQLSDELIDEIHQIMLDYETEMGNEEQDKN